MFKIGNLDAGTEARTGELKTVHGVVKTPFFMPVATKLTVKHVTPMELEEMGVQSIISNAYNDSNFSIVVNLWNICSSWNKCFFHCYC